MEFEEFLKSELEKIKNLNRYRKRFILPQNVVDFSSNDYLGLKDEQTTKEKICQKIDDLSLGSGGSALISGYKQIQKDLEKFLSDFKETENCLVVGSGYLANTGLIPAITTEKDIIFSDEFNHASIIDGIRLSKAKKVIYKHCDINDLKQKIKQNRTDGNIFIITDGVFSMEGDIAPIDEIYKVAEEVNGILIIDDAHSTGILGEGKGTIFHFELKPNKRIIQMGTLSKAVGSYGAFICGTNLLIDFLINKMRTGIFSTALSTIQNFISLENLKLLKEEPFRRKYVLEAAEFIANELNEFGYKINFHGTPILTLVLGDEKRTLRFRDKLLKEGIFIQAIRPPTVPEGKSRLRITISFTHSEKDIILLLNSLKKLTKEV